MAEDVALRCVGKQLPTLEHPLFHWGRIWVQPEKKSSLSAAALLILSDSFSVPPSELESIQLQSLPIHNCLHHFQIHACHFEMLAGAPFFVRLPPAFALLFHLVCLGRFESSCQFQFLNQYRCSVTKKSVSSKTGLGSQLNRPSYCPDDPIGQGTELN